VGELSEHDVPQRVGGDIFDALDKAIHTIDEFVGNKKQDKKVLFHVYSKIFIITAGCGDSDYSEKDL
jgi:ATP-dependent DNA helicase 2 subunit 2